MKIQSTRTRRSKQSDCGAAYDRSFSGPTYSRKGKGTPMQPIPFPDDTSTSEAARPDSLEQDDVLAEGEGGTAVDSTTQGGPKGSQQHVES